VVRCGKQLINSENFTGFTEKAEVKFFPWSVINLEPDPWREIVDGVRSWTFLGMVCFIVTASV
jgi:hypothetical protein